MIKLGDLGCLRRYLARRCADGAGRRTLGERLRLAIGVDPGALAENRLYSVGFVLVVLWALVGINVIGLTRGKHVQNLGSYATFIPAALLIAFGATANISVGLSLDLTQRLGLSFSFEGGDWEQAVGANLGDPDGALVGQYLGYACEVFVQDIGTPAAGTQLDAQTVGLDLAPQTIGRRATRINTSDLNVPGSALVGWKRGLQFPNQVTLTLTKADSAWIADRDARTPFGMLLVFSKGTPGGTPGLEKIGVFLPRVVLDSEPTLTDIDGIEGQQLAFRVEEEALAAPYLYQGCLSFFG